MKTLTTALLALILALAGCGTETDLTGTRFACDAEGGAHGCPDGFECCDGFCIPQGGCQTGDADADSDTDTDADTDSDADMDTDVDADSDTDSDTDTGTSSALECDGSTCVDPTSGLEWEQDPPQTGFTLEEAVTHCEGLGMRMPNIDELRTLVRGCEGMEPEGRCGVTTECNEYASCGLNCRPCDPLDGPSYEGYYWPPEFDGDVALICSTTVVSDDPDKLWGISYGQAIIKTCYNTGLQTRCVR